MKSDGVRYFEGNAVTETPTVSLFLLLIFLWRYNSDKCVGLLDNILPFKAVLYLYCPLHTLHLLQIIPDIIFPS